MTVEPDAADHRPGPVALSKDESEVRHEGTVQHGGSTDGAPINGRIDIPDRVVSKIAARAAVELPHVGAAAPRMLGVSLDALSRRHTDLDDVPKCTAKVDGQRAFLEMTVSVRWPQPVPATCQELREHVSARVEALTGLSVSEVDVTVDALVTEQPRTTARVQ